MDVGGGVDHREVADGGDRLDDGGATRVRGRGVSLHDGGWDSLSRRGDGGRELGMDDLREGDKGCGVELMADISED